MKKKILAALVGLAALGAVSGMATSASAYVICNADGDCWHTHDKVLRPGWVRHPNDWYFHRSWTDASKQHWRNYHQGHGYWRGGVWVPQP